eukprot:m.238268 g.238268  ORF g.238268 m.238268 type:complete len:1600 (-) comp17427_c0_seq3:183-4982(-)
MATFKQQYVGLVKKTAAVKRRSPKEWLFEMFFLVAMAAAALGTSQSIENTVFEAIFRPPVVTTTIYDASNPGSTSVLVYPASLASATLSQALASQINALGGINTTVELVANSSTFEAFFLRNPDRLWAGIELSNKTTPGELVASIRMKTESSNGSPIPRSTARTSNAKRCQGSFEPCPAELYSLSGFTLLQRALYQAWAADNSIAFDSLQVDNQALPMGKIEEDPDSSTQASVILLVSIGFSPLLQYLATSVCAEKEEGIRHAMTMMGMEALPYWLSWLTVYTLMLIPSTLLASFVLAGIFGLAGVLPCFILLFLYGINLIFLAFLGCALVKKSQTAGVIASLANFVLSVLSFAVVLGPGAPGPKFAMSLFPPLAFFQGLFLVMEADQNGADMTAELFGQDGYSLEACYGMLMLDILVYGGLAAIANVMFPGNSTEFTWLYARLVGSSGNETPSSNTQDALEGDREDINVDKNNGITAEGISHQYKGADKYALQNVTLTAVKGQIFGLLGHNGAGKTTLFSILSGSLKPSEGRVLLHGQDLADLSVRNNLRQHLGVCPQHDILFPELTVSEHLELFRAIKGRGCGTRTDDTFASEQELIQRVDLEGKEDSLSAELSGGQKRKLCVALALMGNPKVVTLDEPSSGLDPNSRRKLWALLQSCRADRVILLTTHYMHEADVLADSKAVLAAGRVQCVGSSLFLKQKFGVGYHLDVDFSTALPQHVGDLEKMLIKHSTHITKDASYSSNSQTFTIPPNAVKVLGASLEELEANKDAFHVQSYRVRMTTLEDVFLALREKEEVSTVNSEAGDVTVAINTCDVDQPVEATSLRALDYDYPAPTHPPTSWELYKTALALRWRETWRQGKTTFAAVIFPVILITIAFLAIYKDADDTTPDFDTAGTALAPGLYNTSFSSTVYTDCADASWQPFLTLLSSTMADYNFVSLPSDQSLLGPDALVLDNVEANLAAFRCNGTLTAGNLIIMHNVTAVHALPILLQATLNAQPGLASTLTTQSLPGQQAVEFDTSVYFTGLLVAIGLGSIAGTMTLEVVRDRDIKMKHLLRISNVGPLTYWAAFGTIHGIAFGVASVYIIALVSVRRVEGLIGPATPWFVVITLLYVIQSITYSYIVSFAFRNAKAMQSFWPAVQSMLSMIPFIFVSMLEFGDNSDAAKIAHYVFAVLIPPYTYFGAIFYFLFLPLLRSFDITAPSLTASDYADPANVIMPTLLILVAQCLLFPLILYCLERGYFFERSTTQPDLDKLQSNVANDVVREEERVFTTTSEHPSLAFKHLNVTYAGTNSCGRVKPAYTAVHDLTVRVEKGGIFGLLGPNGAGKTSAISVATGVQYATAGDVEANGVSVTRDPVKAFSDLGFCPQFSALYDKLTVFEHLTSFARLAGFSELEAEKLAQSWMEELKIQEYRDEIAEELSGGTQRKLSLALALIGCPKVSLLDEVSTGLDPASRRMLWDVIRRFMATRACVLTTHSMEEAEALCSTIGILVKGQLQCYGSVQHLIENYGTGYVLEVKLRSEAMVPAFVNWLSTAFPSARVQDRFQSHIVFDLNITSAEVGQVFTLIETQAREQGLLDYGLSQSTLEQVFLRFASRAG